SCRYRLLDNLDIPACFSNVSFLFFGDSTLRGMLYLFLERLNPNLPMARTFHGMRVWKERSLRIGYRYPDRVDLTFKDASGRPQKYAGHTKWLPNLWTLTDAALDASAPRRVILWIGGILTNLTAAIPQAAEWQREMRARGFDVTVVVKSVSAHRDW